MSILVLANIWSYYHTDLNSFNFYVIDFKIPTYSCSYIPLWHGTKENVPPFFSNINYSTQTSNFLLCHLLQYLGSSLTASPLDTPLSGLLPPSLPTSHIVKKSSHPVFFLKLYVFLLLFNRKLLEGLFKTQWISAPLSYSLTHDHSIDVYIKVITPVSLELTRKKLPHSSTPTSWLHSMWQHLPHMLIFVLCHWVSPSTYSFKLPQLP